MKKTILKIAGLSLLAAAIALAPTQGLAQEKKKDDATSEKKGKRQGGIPFRGKIDAVNKDAKTVKVGERTFQITDETRIRKDGNTATLDDAVVGDEVRGSYKEADGKHTALLLRIGPVPEGEKKKKKKE
jgi:hypothetical protein